MSYVLVQLFTTRSTNLNGHSYRCCTNRTDSVSLITLRLCLLPLIMIRSGSITPKQNTPTPWQLNVTVRKLSSNWRRAAHVVCTRLGCSPQPNTCHEWLIVFTQQFKLVRLFLVNIPRGSCRLRVLYGNNNAAATRNTAYTQWQIWTRGFISVELNCA